MEAFKFNTTVLENGIIQIPEISKLANRPIEIFIVVKQPETLSNSSRSDSIEQFEADSNKSQSVEQFLQKWTGFIKGSDPDKNKFEYLKEKYS